MKLLRGYDPKKGMFVEYPYMDIAVYMFANEPLLKIWMPFPNYLNIPRVPIGKANETTKRI